MAADFGDAPLPYSTTLAENGARHETIGPMLGSTRDAEETGLHTAIADGDGADDDGVTFGVIRVGQLDATANVTVQDAPTGARLDAWIDFNGDGSWGGPGEQIASSAAVVDGSNTIRFDVPSWATDGRVFARFRLSTEGALGVGGAASDGEVEDFEVLILTPASTNGDFGEQKTISTTADGAYSVFAADVDGDGDMDALSASRVDGKIAWYENDGRQMFTARIVSAAAKAAVAVFAADIDGDGDLDVLSASRFDNRVVWYENDGSQTFTDHVISSTANGARSVFAADLDGDGDMDVLSANASNDMIAWYENNGDQVFTSRIISASADGARSAVAADVDGDGDLDAVSASHYDNKIAWYENNGNQSFSAHTVSTAAAGAYSVFAADVDGDGDMDLLSASLFDDKVTWYENDGNQIFTARTIDAAAYSATSVFAADIDGDSDMDVLSASSHENKIAWYENNGSQGFTSRTITLDASRSFSVFAADVDSDGDLDVLSASLLDDKIAWYENLTCGSCADAYMGEEDSLLMVDATVGVLANDDAQADELLTASVVSFPSHGELVLGTDGSFTYSPTANYFGTDSFVYRVESNQRASRNAVVTITVNPVPDPPTASNDAFRVNEDATLSVPNQTTASTTFIARNSIWRYLDNGTDQGTAWRAQLFDDATWRSGPAELGYGDGGEATVVDCGPAAGNECTVSNNPNSKYITTYFRRTFTVDDPGRIASLAVNLRRDDGAVVYLNGVELLRDNMPAGAITHTTGAAQAIGDDGANFASFTNLNRTPLVTGLNTIAVEIHQQNQMSSDMSFDLELTGVIITPAGLLANDSDVDGNPVTSILDQPPEVGQFGLNSDGSFTFTPPANYFGQVQFTYRAADGTSLSAPATVTISVDPVNDAPSIVPDTYDINEDLSLVIGPAQGLLANDSDLESAVTVTAITVPPAHGMLDLRIDGSFTYTPQANYFGPDTFRYDATDGATSSTAIVSINVQGVNDPPVTVNDTYSAAAGSTFISATSVFQNDIEVDGDSLQIRLESDASHGALLVNFDGTFSYTPFTGYTGNDSFTYRAFDGNVESNVATVTIAVADSTSDFGDAPLPYPTTNEENGARHEPIGPMLGSMRDAEETGIHSTTADADGIDDDGVTFGPIRAGQLGATATVDVQNASAGARLDAWVDFDADGSWGGFGEQIADTFAVINGSNTIEFDIPSWAAAGQTFARFRLSTSGDLGIRGAAVDGEVEDYQVTVQPPAAAAGMFGAQNTISTDAQTTRNVFAADLDGDGDVDVLSASPEDNKVAWYENDGGQSFTARIVSTTARSPRAVFATDVDGDGDMDILSASAYDDQIAWYENDGSQQFTPHSITTEANSGRSVYAADIDGDGDTDVLSASQYDDKIAWYENDGSEQFTARTISTAADEAYSVSAADVDGDGDLDVLSASWGDSKIAWYENNGSQEFTPRVITTTANSARTAFASDVDSDGDTDVVAASLHDDTIAWYENNGNQAFTKRTISELANGATHVYAADIDGDGDMDVLSASIFDDKIAWYENDGRQNFSARTISTAADGANSLFVADVDGDGDLDVLSASPEDDRIAWYENLSCGVCADTYSVDEDTMLVVPAATGVLVNDGADVGEILSASIVSGPENGTISLAADGSFSYTPLANHFGNDSFTYRVSSNIREPRDAVVIIAVNPIPEPLLAVDDAYSVVEEGELRVPAFVTTETALVPRGSAWRYLDNGTNQGTAWRQRTFNDSAWRSGLAELGYGDGGERTIIDCGPAQGNECVGGNNPNNKYITTYFRKTFTLADASLYEAMTLDYRVDDGAVFYINGVEVYRYNMPSGTIASTTTASSAVEDEGYRRSTSFVTSGLNLVDGDNVLAVEVHQQSASSTDVSFDMALLSDIIVGFGMLANDAYDREDPPVVRSVITPQHGQLYIEQRGAFTYRPNPNFSGVDTFTYELRDGSIFSNVATVRITVTPTSDPPVAISDSYTVNEDTELSVTSGAMSVLANDIDVDGDALTANLVTGPVHGSLRFLPNGTFTYTPDADFFGVDSFAYTAFDGTQSSPPATVSITINAVSDAPRSVSDQYFTQENQTLEVTLSGLPVPTLATFDAEQTPYVLTQHRDGPAPAVRTGGTFGNFLRLTHADQRGLLNSVAFDRTAVGGWKTIEVDFDYRMASGTSTGNGDGMGMVLLNTANHGVSGPAPEFEAEEPNVLGAFGIGFDNYSNFTETDNNVSLHFNGALVDWWDISGNGLDPNNGKFHHAHAVIQFAETGATVTLTLTPNGGTPFTPINSVFVPGARPYESRVAFAGRTGSFTTAADVDNVDVRYRESAPIEAPASSIDLLGVLANDIEVDGDPLSAGLLSQPRNGTLSFQEDGTFTYVPNAGFVGIDQFTYFASEGNLDSAAALVTINVGDANKPPQAADDRFVTRSTALLDVPVSQGVLSNDFDLNGDVISASVLALPTRGSLSLSADGSFVYIPPAGFIGVDAFTYSVADGTGAFGVATATIHVVAIRDPINGIPIVSDDAFEATTAVLSISVPGILANDVDPEQRALFAIIERATWHGSLSFAADGSFTYAPLPAFSGEDTFIYRATDGNTFSAPATVTINVGAAVPADGPVLPLTPVSNLPVSTLPGTQGSTTSPGTLSMSGDLNGDGRVDRADLAVVTAAYGAATGSLAYDAVADLNGDGRVSLADAIVLRNGMIGFSQPSSSNALVRRASDRISDERREIESPTMTATRRSNATIDEVHSPGETSLRAVRRKQAQRPEIRALGSISPALIDRVFASGVGLSASIPGRRERSIGRL